MSESPIVFEGLSHGFGRGRLRHDVLHRVDGEVKEGEIVILTGPSGSGKTTLLTLIGALRSVQKGSLRVLGRELAGAWSPTRVRLRREIGFIFQSHNLVEALTARENVLLALQLQPGLGPFARRRRAVEVLEAVGLGDKLEAHPKQLSGGQRQRVAVARALAGSPRIVLADEPTASLDSATGREIIDRLHQMAREDGVTVFLVTHDHRILDVADRILHLEDGRLSSYTAAVAASTENLLTSLTRTTRNMSLADELDGVPEERFDELLESFTSETRRLQEVVRLAESEAFESLLDQALGAFTRKIGRVLDADRATLFLVDPGTGELWSKYAGSESETPLEIRLSAGAGLAGLVATSGELLNVPDAYEHPLFDRSTDERTGYRTHSVLCAPITGADGRVIAVTQVLNRRDGEPFDAADESEIEEFAQSFAVVLGSWQEMTSRRARRRREGAA